MSHRTPRLLSVLTQMGCLSLSVAALVVTAGSAWATSSGTGRTAGSNSGSCIAGYVPRESGPWDNVCVTPDEQALVQVRNQQSSLATPDNCPPGFVWRGADATDWTCVTAAARDRVAADNSQAASRAYPPPVACPNGQVWRGANATDWVCVPPGERDQVAYDNSQAAHRADLNHQNGSRSCIQGYVWREATVADYVCVTQAEQDRIALENKQTEAGGPGTPTTPPPAPPPAPQSPPPAANSGATTVQTLHYVGLNIPACSGPFSGPDSGVVSMQVDPNTGDATFFVTFLAPSDIAVQQPTPNQTYVVDQRCTGQVATMTTSSAGLGKATFTLPQSSLSSGPFYIDVAAPAGTGAGGYGDTWIAGPFGGS